MVAAGQGAEGLQLVHAVNPGASPHTHLLLWIRCATCCNEVEAPQLGHTAEALARVE